MANRQAEAIKTAIRDEEGDGKAGRVHSRKEYTNEDIIKVFEATGGIVSASARKLGVCRKTLTNWLRDEPILREACDEQKAQLIDLSLGVIHREVRKGNFEAARYVLRCLAREEWRETSREYIQSETTMNGIVELAANEFDSKFAKITGTRRTLTISDKSVTEGEGD